MAASATITFPLALKTPAQRVDASSILNAVPGSEALEIASDGSSATFKLQMPGNIDVIVGKLRKRGLLRGSTLQVSIPVRKVLPEEPVIATAVLERLHASPAISGANFDGDTVTATIGAGTGPMRYIYEELLHLNLRPIDHPTRAGKTTSSSDRNV